MKGLRLAVVALAMALPAGAVMTSSALAHPATKHRHHHHARQVKRKAHTVTFYARVVRASARGLIVRTLSGRTVRFSARQLSSGRSGKHHASKSGTSGGGGQVVINILGLLPGVEVEITETTDANGNLTITITLVSQTNSQDVPGVVSEVETDTFDVTTGDGSDMRFHMSADALSNLNLSSCNTVDVTYHQDAGLLIADNVTVTGTSTSGDCAVTQDATGEITDISDSGVTIKSDGGPMTFSVDPSAGLTDGYQVGDLVDVTYTQNSDGSMTATDVEYVEEETTGQVTSVTTSTDGGSLTILDDNTGDPDTFVADPNNGVTINGYAFNGISVGDEVDVTYHQSAGQLVADTVSEDW